MVKNAATERDVWGGWYDAGDPNKYTSWTAGYVESLLRAYAENPTIWTDDYNNLLRILRPVRMTEPAPR